MSIDGKVAIVTGASLGIGAGIAKRLAQDGATCAGAEQSLMRWSTATRRLAGATRWRGRTEAGRSFLAAAFEDGDAGPQASR